MALPRVVINGKDFVVDKDRFRIKNDLSYRNITDVSVILQVGDTKPRAKDRIEIFDVGGDRVYFGKIEKVKSPIFKTPNQVLRFNLSCIPAITILDDRQATASFVETDMGVVVEYFKKFIIEEELATNFDIEDFSGVPVGKIVFNTESAEVALMEIADQLSAITYIDPMTDTWVFKSIETITSNIYSIDNFDDAHISDLQVEEVGTDARNSHYQLGGTGVTEIQTQKEFGDGEKQAYLMAYEVAQLPVVFVDGVEQNVGKLESVNEIFNEIVQATIKNIDNVVAAYSDYIYIDVTNTSNLADISVFTSVHVQPRPDGNGTRTITTSLEYQRTNARWFLRTGEAGNGFTTIRSFFYDSPTLLGDFKIVVDPNIIDEIDGNFYTRLYINGEKLQPNIGSSSNVDHKVIYENKFTNNITIGNFNTSQPLRDFRLTKVIGRVPDDTELRLAASNEVPIGTTIFGLHQNCRIIGGAFQPEENDNGIIHNKGSVVPFDFTMTNGGNAIIDKRPEWLYAEKSNEISQRLDIAPLTDEQLLEVQYKGIFNASIIVTNSTDVDRRKAEIGGTGLIEKVTTDNTIEDFGVATDVAVAKLDQYLTPREKIKFTIYEDVFDKLSGVNRNSIKVGHTIGFDLPEIYIVGQFIITEIEMKLWYMPSINDAKFKYHYTGFSANADIKKGHGKTLARLVDQNEKLTYNEDETALVVEREDNILDLKGIWEITIVEDYQKTPSLIDDEMIDPTHEYDVDGFFENGGN